MRTPVTIFKRREESIFDEADRIKEMNQPAKGRVRRAYEAAKNQYHRFEQYRAEKKEEAYQRGRQEQRVAEQRARLAKIKAKEWEAKRKQFPMRSPFSAGKKEGGLRPFGARDPGPYFKPLPRKKLEWRIGK